MKYLYKVENIEYVLSNFRYQTNLFKPIADCKNHKDI